MTTPAQPVSSAESKDERTWGMLCHIAALAGLIIPFGHIIGPLVVWLIKREEFPLVADQGKEVLNFQISMTIYYIIAAILIIILIGIVLLIGLALFSVIMTIIGAIKANEGVRYRYPLTIRMIS